MASAPEARASASRRANCSAASAARSASMPLGEVSGVDVAPGIESRTRRAR
jgi:hypothetical protein